MLRKNSIALLLGFFLTIEEIIIFLGPKKDTILFPEIYLAEGYYEGA